MWSLPPLAGSKFWAIVSGAVCESEIPWWQVDTEWPQPPKWAKQGEITRILYFGDSVDAAQVLDVCREAQRHGIGVWPFHLF